jgi:hypothetical protein
MPDKMQITVTVSQDKNRVTVELDPEDLINLKVGDEINQVNITLAGEQIALLQRFRGTMPGTGPIGGPTDPAGLN